MRGFSTLGDDGEPQEMSCYTFDLENDDPDQPDANFINCPIYSNHGCFKARGYWTPGDEDSIRYYKGCSAYPFEVLGQQGLTVSLVMVYGPKTMANRLLMGWVPRNFKIFIFTPIL